MGASRSSDGARAGRRAPHRSAQEHSATGPRPAAKRRRREQRVARVARAAAVARRRLERAGGSPRAGSRRSRIRPVGARRRRGRRGVYREAQVRRHGQNVPRQVGTSQAGGKGKGSKSKSQIFLSFYTKARNSRRTLGRERKRGARENNGKKVGHIKRAQCALPRRAAPPAPRQRRRRLAAAAAARVGQASAAHPILGRRIYTHKHALPALARGVRLPLRQPSVAPPSCPFCVC